jgi:hypothetical protein
MATIEYDDQQGICAALPVDRPMLATSCDPRHGFSVECALPATSCALSGGSAGGTGSALFLALGLSSTLLRKKLRRAARRP